MQVKSAAWFLVVAMVFFTSAARLPAPISEVSQPTPSPKPKQEVTHPSKPKPETSPKPSSTLSFAGTWRGTTSTAVSDGGRTSADYIIKISDDEKTALISWRGRYVTISGPDYQATCIRLGNALSWRLKQIGENPTWIETDTLRLNSNGTASFVCKGSVIAGEEQGITFTNSGTLSRQEKPATSLRR
jgi:hypothetical protein